MGIYIPLWFYSNARPLNLSLNFFIFTFHYGSILMETSNSQNGKTVKFTFHYDSILISIFKDIDSILTTFTFHYGSILI